MNENVRNKNILGQNGFIFGQNVNDPSCGIATLGDNAVKLFETVIYNFV
jgi:hypothetical protein